jgi:hypothetical protein
MSQTSVVHVYIGGDQYQMESLTRDIAETFNIPVQHQGYLPPHRMVSALLKHEAMFRRTLGDTRYSFIIAQVLDYLELFEAVTTDIVSTLKVAGDEVIDDGLYTMPIGLSKPRVVMYDLNQNTTVNSYAKHTDSQGQLCPIEMAMLIQRFD